MPLGIEDICFKNYWILSDGLFLKSTVFPFTCRWVHFMMCWKNLHTSLHSTEFFWKIFSLFFKNWVQQRTTEGCIEVGDPCIAFLLFKHSSFKDTTALNEIFKLVQIFRKNYQEKFESEIFQGSWPVQWVTQTEPKTTQLSSIQRLSVFPLPFFAQFYWVELAFQLARQLA